MNRTTPTTTKIGLEVTNSTSLPSLEVTTSTTLPNSTTEPAGGGSFDGIVTKTHVGVIVACGAGGLLLLVCFIIYYRYKTITTRKRRFLRLTTGRPNYQEAARELTLPKN
uniref:Uncharacterized protein n=1 Tax=Ciona savignyi TaxID=51511 RepID=H2YU43_CIOSA